MNESYVECLIKRKSSLLNSLLKVIMIVFVVIVLLGGLLFGNMIVLIIAIAIGIGAYYVYPMFDIEYEYLYLDREISIDKIMAKQRRKRVATYDVGKMEILAPENSHELDPYRSRNIKVIDYSSNMDDHKKYLMAYHDETSECLVKFEPNEEMIKCIKQIAPRKVKEY
ncbi:MAG: DUF6106 family protein [Lachnospiraceae bacterium]|nr:DUF6106 family protein [Lachnospiraceae bacterium]